MMRNGARFPAGTILLAAAFVLALLLAGCGGRVDRDSRSFVERDTLSRADTTTPGERPVAPKYSLLAAGEFGRNDYRVSGMAALLRNETHTVLRLQDFQAEGRPGLQVFLAADGAGAGMVSLGPLQGYSGTFDYSVPAGTDTGSRNHVIIFSKESSRVLAYAAME